jgi:CHAT domain-containing protein
MESFYRHLAEGATVVAAMRQARSDLRDSPERSHPYYWAPFILIGQWR